MAVHHATAGSVRPAFGMRLMILCPVTGAATDTGFELSAMPQGPDAGEQLLVDCLECGQDHAWRMEESFAESFADVADGLLAAPAARGWPGRQMTRRMTGPASGATTA